MPFSSSVIEVRISELSTLTILLIQKNRNEDIYIFCAYGYAFRVSTAHRQSLDRRLGSPSRGWGFWWLRRFRRLRRVWWLRLWVRKGVLQAIPPLTATTVHWIKDFTSCNNRLFSNGGTQYPVR